ncbi:MAG: Ig-like domain-containing protein, partial [Planctomycetota bacterium]
MTLNPPHRKSVRHFNVLGHDRNLLTVENCIKAVEYIHNNPVRAGGNGRQALVWHGQRLFAARENARKIWSWWKAAEWKTCFVTDLPYEFQWKYVPFGSYVLVAQALNDRGAVALSAPVVLIVKNSDQPPPVPPPDPPQPPVPPPQPAPVAVADYYTTDGFNPRAVIAPGLLSNDLNPSGQPITVTQTSVSQPRYGSVAVNADGSFVYTPGPDFAGTDSFTY